MSFGFRKIWVQRLTSSTHSFNKDVLNVHYVLDAAASSGDITKNKTKFLLLYCCSNDMRQTRSNYL